jgi:NTE family protein
LIQLRTAFTSILACLLIAGTSAFAQDRQIEADPADGQRPTIGVAFGGGSARGLAHIGVIRWFEEHRIPIDMAAGTSMGGLIGGGFATGMDAAELDDLIKHLNWDELFGSSAFAYKNIRRKADARAYPSRLEFGLKRGIVPPVSLNNGEQVDLLVGRIAAPYFSIRTFDDLPTPFRTVAVDLLSATPVVMDRGSLATAMRATMSLPLIFPPVQRDGQVLVDGGAMDNVPADVVKAMGAGRVVAINVGDLADLKEVNYSLLGLAGETLDAMMRANTKAGMKQADIIINVPLADYGSLDWRKSDVLIAEGYKAAESMRDRLLPLAVSEAEYARWTASRKSRRRTALPVPVFLRVEGFSVSDQRRLSGLLAGHVGVALDLAAIEADLTALSGLDRYETITWRTVTNANGENGLLIEARVKPYGPPFLMVGFNLENTTSQDFRLRLTARYLRYDIAGSGSELRIDGTIGSDPGIGAEIYRPLGSSPLFFAPYAGIGKRTFDVIDGDVIRARYAQSAARVGADFGVNLGLPSDVRVGVSVARLSTTIEVGDPGLPEVDGKETAADIKWRYDTQDSPVVPSRGINASATLRHIFDSPDVERPLTGDRTSTGLTQLAGEMNAFRSIRERDRLFVLAGGGTSFSSQPLPTDQFALGFPFHLGSYDNGEIRGDHYYIATAGYLRRVGRLPDFLGGPIFAGAWLENGDAFDDWSKATLRTNASAGVVMDTIIGPVILAGSAGFDGRWRTYLGVGRLFARRQ